MTSQPDLRSTDDHIQAALDASCAALLAIQSGRDAVLAAEAGLQRAEAARSQAIALVRTAISELRVIRGDRPSPLAYGFAFAQGRALSEAPAAAGAQTTSLRTA